MNYLHIYSFILCCVIIFSSCQNDGKDIKHDINSNKTVASEGTVSIQTTIEDDTKLIAEKPVIAPKDAEKIINETRLTKVSPFLNLGCCSTVEQRQESCCCDAVLTKYEKMVKKKVAKLADYSMTDPILGDCRRKKPELFDAVDNPIIEEDNYDDLF